jgi:hypothetical protein
MPAPDYEAPSDATPGEWKALLAPMLAVADSAEEVAGYVVIAASTGQQAELRTNMSDEGLRALLQIVMPEACHG